MERPEARRVASSFMAIWKEPSPHTTTTCRSRWAVCTPMAAGRA